MKVSFIEAGSVDGKVLWSGELDVIPSKGDLVQITTEDIIYDAEVIRVLWALPDKKIWVGIHIQELA